ncbi:hypothetical protein PFISCL1PPCAC_28850, partial [Pristionchus fissidentatus]
QMTLGKTVVSIASPEAYCNSVIDRDFAGMMFTDLQHFHEERMGDMDEFRMYANDAWAQMIHANSLNGFSAARLPFEVRGKRSASHCGCAKGPNNCPAGPAGPPGAPGEAGLDGDNGADGQAGTAGIAFSEQANGGGCISCPAGEAGPAGPDGDVGEPGQDGYPGESGRPGSNGQPGAQGEQGDAGRDGAPGRDGRPGGRGKNGKRGQGAAGVAGRVGAPGHRGKNGAHGRPGLSGTPGPQGPQGVAGQPGLRGGDGYPGEQGGSGLPGAGRRLLPLPPSRLSRRLSAYVEQSPATGYEAPAPSAPTYSQPPQETYINKPAPAPQGYSRRRAA